MNAKYVNGAQQRALKALILLAGNEVVGLAPGEIASALRSSASNTTRDLANLREAGLAEQLDSGRWRITPLMGQLALRVLRSLDDARQRVEEVQQRFTTDR